MNFPIEMNHPINLIGTWLHQSFLVTPTFNEEDEAPPSAITARRWAKGKLTISESEGDRVLGELVFASGITLRVDGRILPATETLPAVLEATGIGSSDATKGAMYQITGWIIFDPTKEVARPTIRGSILSVATDLAGEPMGTVGSFVLKPF